MHKDYIKPQCEEVFFHTETAFLVGSNADSVNAGSLGYYETERWVDGITD